MPDRQYFQSSGVTISYRVWGNCGPALFLLHGLGSDSRQFEDDAETFAQAGFTVIVPDLRGHGESDCPLPLTTESMHVRTIADDIDALMQALRIDCAHFVGNSMGGVVALALINKSPERALSLTTFGTVYALSFPFFVPFLQYAAGRLIGAKRLAELTAKKVTDHERTRAVIREIYPSLDIRMVHAVQRSLIKYDYLEAAIQFSGPILILKGDSDTEINKYLPKTLKALEARQGVRIVDIENAGHFTNTDQPDTTQKTILGFLSETVS